MNISNKEIGELIKNKRIELGLSQDKLAKLMGFKSSGSIFKIEKGIASITIEQLQEFSKILNFEISEIFKKNDSKKEWKCCHCGNHSFLIITTQKVTFNKEGEIENIFDDKEINISCSYCCNTKSSIREIAEFKKVEEK